jgi:hypothetical protein
MGSNTNEGAGFVTFTPAGPGAATLDAGMLEDQVLERIADMHCVKTPASVESLEEAYGRTLTTFIKRLRCSIAEAVRLRYLSEARDPTAFLHPVPYRR